MPWGRRSWRRSVVSMMPSVVASGTSLWESVIWIVRSAARPSSLRSLAPCSAKGDATALTWSSCSSSSTAAATACRVRGSSARAPSGATTIMVALVPLTSGKVRPSVSIASCDSVPGMVIGAFAPCENRPAAMPSTARIAIHIASTSHLARVAQSPIAWSRVDMGWSLSVGAERGAGGAGSRRSGFDARVHPFRCTSVSDSVHSCIGSRSG